MKFYTIDCEFDMGFYDYYRELKDAVDAIEHADWELLVGITAEEAKTENLVSIKEHEHDVFNG